MQASVTVLFMVSADRSVFKPGLSLSATAKTKPEAARPDSRIAMAFSRFQLRSSCALNPGAARKKVAMPQLAAGDRPSVKTKFTLLIS
jgi:hypothetical protein